MSYSDDTYAFMSYGIGPTMREWERIVGRGWCESCGARKASTQITFGDGVPFMLCDECRPFDLDIEVHDLIPPSF